MLTQREKTRYHKHIMMPEVGEEGQEKLKKARVLVIGAGGLGCPVLQYLTAAGVGTIGLVEFDIVDEPNLQRQILYGTMDKGKLKSIISRDRLSLQNDHVNFDIHNIRFDTNNALKIAEGFDILVDATDNYESRYIINDASVILDKPLVHGAIYKFEGQVSLFNYMGGPTYRCYNPRDQKLGANPLPSDIGLFGVLPGITGTYMANEVIKVIVGLNNTLSGKILIFNILNYSSYTINIDKNPDNLNINNLSIKV